MHLDGLDLNLLVSMDALLSERNVTRASERLHVSQPAMSCALQKLRAHFSDPLLERVGRQLELTPRARALAGPLKEILFEVRALFNDGDQFNPAQAERTFKIVMSNSCAEVFGVQLVHELARIAPGISCQIDELSIEALSRLHNGQVDLCVTLPQSALFDPASCKDGLCAQSLFSDRFVLAGARDNPLLNRPMDYATFCQQVYVDVQFGGNLVSNVELALRQHSARPRIRVRAPTYFHALSMVSGTDMVTIVPARLLHLHQDYLELRGASAPLALRDIEQTALWHSRTNSDPGHRWLRQVLGEVASRMPPSPDLGEVGPVLSLGGGPAHRDHRRKMLVGDAAA